VNPNSEAKADRIMKSVAAEHIDVNLSSEIIMMRKLENNMVALKRRLNKHNVAGKTVAAKDVSDFTQQTFGE
jgi:DNA polymerase-4